MNWSDVEWASELSKTRPGTSLVSDPDGNPIYVGDWDPDFDALPSESPEERLARQQEEAVSASLKD